MENKQNNSTSRRQGEIEKHTHTVIAYSSRNSLPNLPRFFAENLFLLGYIYRIYLHLQLLPRPDNTSQLKGFPTK